jgi:hypothetical protein
MSDYLVDRNVLVRIKIEDPNVIDRCVNDEDGWRTRMFYDLDTEEKVLSHLAYNCIANGVDDASRLDGWADLAPGVATMEIVDVD